MRSFINNHKYFFLLTGLFILSELIVNPIGNFPLNDDWTYGKSTLLYHTKGIVTVGEFAAMTLYTHILWGALFTKYLGFSFTVLRFSTLVSSFIGMLTMFKLVQNITRNQVAAFVACLALLYNPLYFNLSNTYMTDVNFNTLLLLCCYFAYDFFRSKRIISFLLVFVLSTLLVLIRQFGIIVPVCFTFVCLFLNERRWIYTAAGVLLLAGVYSTFQYYENYLRGIVPEWAAYKFSGNVKITSAAFWDLFKMNWDLRYKQILLNILLYSAPFAALFLRHVVKDVKLTGIVFAIATTSLIVFFWIGKETFPVGNIFINMALGAETFYQSLHLVYKNPVEHTYSGSFEIVLLCIKYCFIFLTVLVMLLGLMRMIRLRINPLKGRPGLFFLFCVLFAYIFMILITESYFDRYHIPVITLSILILSHTALQVRTDLRFTLPALLIFFYIAVFGTKDYLELNRNRWAAYAYLTQKEKVNPDWVNGGFEVTCWNDGKPTWWRDFYTLPSYYYLIQYRKEPGFRVYKEYKFQRYFPYKKDSIFIYIR